MATNTIAVSFDRDEAGGLRLAMEGGHSVARIIHANGDQTGAEIQRLLVARAQTRESIELREQTFVLDLVTQGAAVRGVIACLAKRVRIVRMFWMTRLSPSARAPVR